MSIFAKAKKARENKKGFTLVELIVVLVILAILAAMLVPALLGWIDEARKKEYVLEARNVYMATQAVVDELYAAGETIPAVNTKLSTVAINKDAAGNITLSANDRVAKISDAQFSDIEITSYSGREGGATEQAEISGMVITGLTVGDKAGVEATLANGEWTINDELVSSERPS